MKCIEQLIAKYLTKNLSEEETEYLRRWVEELPGREEYLRRLAERNDFSVKYRRYEAVDAEGAKRRFLRKIRRRQIFDTTHWAWYSAAAVAALIVVSVWFSRTSESEAPAFLLSEVAPGTTQAVLVLENGSEFSLTRGGETIAFDDSLSARTEDGAITYNPGYAVKSPEYHTLVVPRGGEYRITLSDGTRVHINADSKLRFPVAFSGSERRVQLSGEAYFEVAKEAARPFVVEAGAARVRQYGTIFNINTYNDAAEVVLVSGAIGVSRENGAEVSLAPGQLAVCDEGIEVRDVDVLPYIAWTKGRFTFDDERLVDIAEDLMRWYDVEIEILDPEIADMRFTGSVGRDQSIERIMNAISYTQNVRVEVKENKIEIFK